MARTRMLVLLFLCLFGAHRYSLVAQQQGSSDQASAPQEHSTTGSSLPPTPLSGALGLYRSGKLDEAKALYESLIKSMGAEAAPAYSGLASVLLKQKRVSEAYAAAAKAVELDPKLAVAHSALGKVYFRQGKLAEAEQEFLIPLRAKQPDAGSSLGLARINWIASNYKRAKALIDQAHRFDGADPEIRKVWLLTLSPEDQLKGLKEYLSESNDDPEEKEELSHYLTALADSVNTPKSDCRLVTKVASTKINLNRLFLDSERTRGYGLTVKVNETSSNLFVDTGATGILINSKIAEKAKLRRVVDQGVRGIGDKGAANGYVGYAESIKIGGLEFQGCYVDVVDKKRMMGEDGLIGADVFEDFLVDIDFPDAKLQLSELPVLPDEGTKPMSLRSSDNWADRLHDRYIAPEMKSYERVFRFGHNLLIPTYVNRSSAKLFVIDTGGFDNLMSLATAREVSKVYGDPDTKVKGLSGDVSNVYRTHALALTFGKLRQRRDDLVAFDLTGISDSLGTEVGGILGFGMLKLLDIKIDYRDGLVNFTYDENRIPKN
jgi:tetratricopeptide (TPR) repeat protein